MKKILYTTLVILTLTTLTCIATPETVTPQNVFNNVSLQLEPEYMAVQKKDVTFYYDKSGKMIARDKSLNNNTFFYNNVGQLVGRSTRIAGKKYYYNQIGKFIGICDSNGECQDEKFMSTGKIPPLPTIKKFTPYVDLEALNASAKKSNNEEE